MKNSIILVRLFPLVCTYIINYIFFHQIKWYVKSDEINQLPSDNPETIPYKNPCIIVDNYNVFIIGGKTKSGKYLSTTWRAAFDVIPDQVNTVIPRLARFWWQEKNRVR